MGKNWGSGVCEFGVPRGVLAGFAAVVHDDATPGALLRTLAVEKEADLLLDAEEMRAVEVDVAALFVAEQIAFDEVGVLVLCHFIHVCLLLTDWQEW